MTYPDANWGTHFEEPNKGKWLRSYDGPLRQRGLIQEKVRAWDGGAAQANFIHLTEEARLTQWVRNNYNLEVIEQVSQPER